MGQLESNANCTFYSEEEYAWQVEDVLSIPVPEPVNPFPIRVTFDLSGLPMTMDRLAFNLRTTPIEPPLYRSIEYVGPFQTTMDFVPSDTRNEWPFSFNPSISIFYDKERAICYWSSEKGVYIQNGRGHPHFKLELLPYRRMDLMVGFNITRVR